MTNRSADQGTLDAQQPASTESARAAEKSGWMRGAHRPNLSSPVRLARRAAITGYTSVHTRRLLPVRLTFPLARVAAAATRRRANWLWTENRRYFEELLRYTPLAGSEEEVAERAVAEFLQCSEIGWRPWLMAQGEIDGIEHFSAAHSAGRGVVGVFPHFGICYGQFPILHRYGIDAWVIASPHHYVELGNGYDGRFARHAKKYVDLLGEDHAIVRAGGGVPTDEGAFARSLRLLREGATVLVAWDSVGTLPTPFLGRMLHLASGAAKLACASDAMVAPYVHRMRDYRPVIAFERPLDPRDYEGPEQLQAAIAAIMERWALERPESVWPLESQPGGPPLIKGPPLAEADRD